jgi:hypothetical protein
MSHIGSIASRIKKRVRVAARRGRVGGTEHKKLIERRKSEFKKKLKNKNMKIEC